MKKFIYLVCMAVMATATMTVSSCGDDEKDEIENTVDNSLTAVHKIKITMTGNIDKFKWSVNFKGMTWHDNVASMATIYDANGNAIEGYVENIPDISGETNKYGTTLAAAVVVTDFGANNTDEISVKLEGFKNGKLTNAKTFDIKGSGYGVHSFAFTTIPTD